MVDIVRGGYLNEVILCGGFCSGGYCPGEIILEPIHMSIFL